jgi:MFS family permease
LGLFGFIITLFVVPFLTNFAPRSSIILVGVLCSIGHSLVYGLATSASVITSLAFLGSMSYACIPTLLSYMKGSDADDSSHGTKLGAFNAIASVSKTVGPPLLALCLQSYLDHRGLCYIDPIHNFVGAGFVVLSVSLVPAIVASILLMFDEITLRRRPCNAESGSSMQ